MIKFPSARLQGVSIGTPFYVEDTKVEYLFLLGKVMDSNKATTNKCVGVQ